MNLHLLLHCCYIFATLSVRNIYGSDLHNISLIEKNESQDTFVYIKLKGIVQQNKQLFESIKTENNKLLDEIFNNQKQLQEIESKVITKIAEIEKKILSKIEDGENVCREEKIEEMLKTEANSCRNEQLEMLEKQVQRVESKITKITEMESISKQQTEILQASARLEKNYREIQNELALVLGKATSPENCQDVLRRGYTENGIYTIQPKKSHKSFDVFCDFNTRGGGWIIILNRFDGSQDFYLNWEDYKNGFGSLSAEFWLGFQHVYDLITSDVNYELLVELVDWTQSTKRYALYDNFILGDEKEGYKIKELGSYTGDAGDSLSTHKNHSFVTKDRDNCHHCATGHKGAWWYDYCWKSHLTGLYYNRQKAQYTAEQGMSWFTVTGFNRGLKEARMLIRPKDTSTKKS